MLLVCYFRISDYYLYTSFTLKLNMSGLRAKAVLIGDEVHVAGNKDQWGRGGEASSSTAAAAGASKKPVFGVVDFEQQGDTIVVSGKIEGLGQNTLHGFHIHEKGDMTNGCSS